MLGISLCVEKYNKKGEVYKEEMDIINSEWMLTQFLTYQRGETRSIVKIIEDARISYQKLKANVLMRQSCNTISYDYIDSINNAIGDCFKAFKSLYDHIETTYCSATPVKLGYKDNLIKVLEKQILVSDQEKKKYFEGQI